jgi:hypothetical protein
MISVTIARAVLLGMAVLALLTATVLDGVMMRLFVQPFLRFAAERAGQAVQPPRPLAFMIQRAWARRLYHLFFAALLLAGWWYLGTDTGVAHWARMQQPSSP